MGRPSAEDSKRKLRDNVGARVARTQLAPRGRDQAHRRVHMRARNRPEHGDQNEQDRPGGERIAKERDGVVPAAQTLSHDPRPDHGREQEERAKAFSCKPPRQTRRRYARAHWVGMQQAALGRLSPSVPSAGLSP